MPRKMTIRKTRIFFSVICGVVFIFLYYYIDYMENIRQIELGRQKNILISSGTFQTSLINVLDKHQFFSSAEQSQVAKAYAKLIDLKRLRPSDKYSIIFSTSRKFGYMVIRRGLKRYALFKKKEGGFRARMEPIKIYSQMKYSSGTIRTSLWISMADNGVPPPVILDFSDIFSWSVDFLTEVRDGDRYRVFYEEKKTKSGEMVSRKILAASYKGKVCGEKNAIFFRDTYYDAKGRSMRSLFLRAPLHYRRISSYFSYHRFHPILKYVRPHLGIDYAAPRGTPVSAVANGRVIYKGWKGGFGRYIAVRHGYGYVTTYGHLWKYARGLKVGKRVKQGEVIGYVGASGLATGPHLDFRIKRNGRYLNFLRIKYRPSKNLPRKYFKEFKKVYNSYFKE